MQTASQESLSCDAVFVGRIHMRILSWFWGKRNFAANAQTRLNCNMYSFFQEKIACN